MTIRARRRRYLAAGVVLSLAVLSAGCAGSEGSDTATPATQAPVESSPPATTAVDTSETTVASETTVPTVTEAPVDTSGPVPGGFISIASTTPVALWDINSSVANETSGFAYPLVFGQLLKNVDGKLVPDLLESATPSTDFTTWTLTLRDGVKFSDGSPATSADLKFTLDQLAANPSYAYLIGTPAADAITAVDDLTVKLALTAPDSEVDTLGLSATTVNLYRADFGGMTPEQYFLKPIGAGPFTIESNDDSGMRLVRNDGYWDAANVYLDGVDVFVVPDNNAKLIGFQSGDYDIVTRQPSSVIGQLDDAGAALIVKPSSNIETLFLNGGMAPFDDVNFRQAVWYGVDRDVIAQGIFDGQANPATGMIPSALPGQTPGSNPPSYDPDRAREFLAKSAYAANAAFDLILIDGDGTRREEAQVISDQLAKIGITVNVKPLGYAEWSALAFASKHQATLYGYEAVVDPPSDIVGFFAVTSGFFGQYDTTDALAKFYALQATDDPAKKSALLAEFETNFSTQAYAVPIVEPYWIFGVADRVVGLHVPITGIPDLAGVSVTKT